jgi:anti-sigma B factor antagonist
MRCGRLRIMGVTERTLTLDECRSELFESFQMPCFWDTLDFELLGTQKRGHVVVLDFVGTLLRSEKQELHARIKRLVERGERTIVLNLQALTKVDSAGLGELVQAMTTVIRAGGTMPLVHAPRHFRHLVASMKFL